MSKIKICGLFRECDIQYVNEAKPDFAGFIFARSKRKIDEKTAAGFRERLSDDIQTVGVFVDEDIPFIRNLCDNKVIDVIQLHGNEAENYINRLKDCIDNPIIKAVRVQSRNNIKAVEKLDVDYLLLDTYVKDVMGGTGKTFDWSLIGDISKPFFLAGGVDTGNINEALETGAYCIDVSSGAETDGFKDKEKILEIVRRVRL
jgi:phosphoribosylanthranilate isomerase